MSTPTAESILKSISDMMRDFGKPPDFDTLQVGSMRYARRLMAAPRDPRMAPAPYFAGFRIVENRALPPYRGVLSGRAGKLAIVDFRKAASTDDMVQMLADLQRSGGAPA